MSKRTFAVWESEYPEEGSVWIEAATEEEAITKYRRMTGEKEPDPTWGLTELNASELTAEKLKRLGARLYAADQKVNAAELELERLRHGRDEVLEDFEDCKRRLYGTPDKRCHDCGEPVTVPCRKGCTEEVRLGPL